MLPSRARDYWTVTWCLGGPVGLKGRDIRLTPTPAAIVWGGFGRTAFARGHGRQSHWAISPTHVPCAPCTDNRVNVYLFIITNRNRLITAGGVIFFTHCILFGISGLFFGRFLCVFFYLFSTSDRPRAPLPPPTYILLLHSAANAVQSQTSNCDLLMYRLTKNVEWTTCRWYFTIYFIHLFRIVVLNLYLIFNRFKQLIFNLPKSPKIKKKVYWQNWEKTVIENERAESTRDTVSIDAWLRRT